MNVRENSRVILDMLWLGNIQYISLRQITKGGTSQSIKLPKIGKALVEGLWCTYIMAKLLNQTS